MTECSLKSSSFFEPHPPLDLTRRRTGSLDVHGDSSSFSSSSVESSESNSDSGDFRLSTRKSEVDSEREVHTGSRSSPRMREDRLVRVKSEDSSLLSDPSPDPLFSQGHSIGRFINYVHQMNSVAMMRQQYLHHFPQPHLGPPSAPLLPSEILPPLGPQFHLPTSTLARSVSVPCPKKLEEKQASRPPVKDESYFERRRKNNEAAKRSRDLRRIKEEEMAKRAKMLENENSVLRAENNVLRFEIRRLHSLLSNTLNNPER